MPGQERLHTLMTEALQTLRHLLSGKFLFRTALGEELVGIAYQFLLQCFRRIVTGWQGQLLAFYLFLSDACACVPFAYPGVSWKPFFTQYLPTDHAVPDVWLVSAAEDGGGVAPTYANVVEHSSLLNKRSIETHLRMTAAHL